MTNEEKYLDWVNNFITISRFAEYYGMAEDEAIKFVNRERIKNHNLYSK